MKKLIALVTALMLLAAPALAETPQPNPLTDQAFRQRLAVQAQPLVSLMASSVFGDGFDGAPDAQTAWYALSAYGSQILTDGQVCSDAEMAAMYADLFYYGAFHQIGETPMGSFEAADGGYLFHMGDGDPNYQMLVNDQDSFTDQALFLDVSLYAMDPGGYPMVFERSAVAVLAPSPSSYFGAQVAGWIAVEAPAFPTAQSDAQLHDQEGNNYAPSNAIDGKLDTCWAYPLTGNESVALTLMADEPQLVRGISITPGYAKSAYAFSSNRRVAHLTLTLSTGQQFEWALNDVAKEDYQGAYVLTLGGVYDASSATLQVTGTYPGDLFDDVCISEVFLF